MRSACPHPNLKSLRYVNSKWIIEDSHGELFFYEQVRIAVDTGFHKVVHLQNSKQSGPYLVLFYDQLSIDTWRQFNLLNRLAK